MKTYYVELKDHRSIEVSPDVIRVVTQTVTTNLLVNTLTARTMRLVKAMAKANGTSVINTGIMFTL